MTISTLTRPGALSTDQMHGHLAQGPSYGLTPKAAAIQYSEVAKSLWGGRIYPLMANSNTKGRYSGAKLDCPPTACTGTVFLEPRAQSRAWRNLSAIENIVCVEGSVELLFGPKLEGRSTLGLFDMASVPADVRHQWVNVGDKPARIVTVLSIPPGASYNAVFGQDSRLDPAAADALGVQTDEQAGLGFSEEELEARTTRFAALVPYKKDLNRTGGLPPEATMALSAGSVFPLIVPEGHIGRSRTAPMYGNQGLYMSIAECTAGNDGPPPHSHSDTQESFYVLNGSFDICTGFDNESKVAAKPHDLFATPNNVMRTFCNTDSEPSRLLVIIQGPDRMQDTVSFSQRIGNDFIRRFGEDIIPKYEAIRMTFDAEERLSA